MVIDVKQLFQIVIYVLMIRDKKKGVVYNTNSTSFLPKIVPTQYIFFQIISIKLVRDHCSNMNLNVFMTKHGWIVLCFMLPFALETNFLLVLTCAKLKICKRSYNWIFEHFWTLIPNLAQVHQQKLVTNATSSTNHKTTYPRLVINLFDVSCFYLMQIGCCAFADLHCLWFFVLMASSCLQIFHYHNFSIVLKEWRKRMILIMKS